APRAAQRADPGGDRDRALSRHPDRQLGADRDRVQPAGPRQGDRRRAQPARLHDAAGPDGDLLLPDRGGEHPDRPDLRHDRSAGEARMTPAETPAQAVADAPEAEAPPQTRSAVVRAFAVFNANKT